MTSPSRPSRESTTRSSRFPQNGHRITAAVYHEPERALLLRRHVFPTQSFARKQEETCEEDRQRADDVKQHRHGHAGVDAELIKPREHELTGFMEAADAARRGN